MTAVPAGQRSAQGAGHAQGLRRLGPRLGLQVLALALQGGGRRARSVRVLRLQQPRLLRAPLTPWAVVRVARDPPRQCAATLLASRARRHACRVGREAAAGSQPGATVNPEYERPPCRPGMARGLW